MPRVLLLLPTSTYRAEALLAGARSAGTEAVVACDRANAVVGRESPGYLTLDFRAPRAAARAVARHARERPLDAVVPVDEETAVGAAAIGEELGLPHNPLSAVEAARDKHTMRLLLRGAGLPGPEFRLVAQGEDEEASRAVRYPCVLKPRFLAGSRGVVRADDPPAFMKAAARIRRILAETEVAERGGRLTRTILVEDYVAGPEVALEGLLRAGRLRTLALFDKPDPMEGPTFAETIYLTPSRLEEGPARRVRETCDRAARALGLVEGPVHAELRLREGEPWLLEIAARSIGGRCSRVLRFGSGVSLEELVLRHALGEETAPLEREPDPAGVLMLHVPEAGVLEEVRGLEAARAVAGVEEVSITVPLGAEVRPLPEGSRYLGFVFARGGSARRVEEALREAWRRIVVVVSPSRP